MLQERGRRRVEVDLVPGAGRVAARRDEVAVEGLERERAQAEEVRRVRVRRERVGAAARELAELLDRLRRRRSRAPAASARAGRRCRAPGRRAREPGTISSQKRSSASACSVRQAALRAIRIASLRHRRDAVERMSARTNAQEGQRCRQAHRAARGARAAKQSARVARTAAAAGGAGAKERKRRWTDVELVGLYWTVSGPVEVHVGREWSLFDFRDRCAQAQRVGFSGIGIWHADLEHVLETRTLARDAHDARRPRPARASSSSA